MKKNIKPLYNLLVLFILFVALLAGCGGDGGGAGGTGGTTPQGNAPSPPVGVVAIGGIGNVTLSWYAVPDATSYNIYWSTTAGVTAGSGTKIENVTSPYNHTGLTNGIPYYYVVTAVKNRESKASSPVSATPQATGLSPSAPTEVVAAAVNNQIVINWTGVSDAVSYKIYWSNAPGVDKTSTSMIEVGNGTSYTHTGLISGKTYYYVITAINDYGESAESNPVVSAMISNTGMLQGYVKDAGTKAPLSGATINIFSNYSTPAASRATNSFGVYTASLAMGTYSMTTSKTGYIPENVSNIRIQGNVTTTLETILQVSEQYTGTGTVTGTIINALDATGVSGVTLNLRDGINTTAGDIVATVTTNFSGGYTVPYIEAGNYTAEATVTGADPSYFTVTVIGGQTNDHQDATITPELSQTAIRIVLTWDSGLDLDSHLTGPILNDRFHVYWYKENIGSSTSSPYAKLDIDDRDGYGPETITIYQQYDGVYRYLVHDHSHIDDSDSPDLSSSSAQVKIYKGSSLLETFNVPAGQGGNLWTVFEMTGDTITPVNTMRDESNTVAVLKPSLQGTASAEPHSEAQLIEDLPPKK